METFLYLSNAYCIPNYGLELWGNTKLFKSQIFKSFEISYCKALKKIANVYVHSLYLFTVESTQNGIMTYLVKSATDVKEDSKSKFSHGNRSSLFYTSACSQSPWRNQPCLHIDLYG